MVPPGPTERERQILMVTLELLVQEGYERLTIDTVAARARASKATIYRRWPGKAALVSAAMRELTDSDHLIAEYSGDLRADLVRTVKQIRDRLAAAGSLLTGMVHAMQGDEELAGLVREDVRKSQVEVDALLDRYINDGVIADGVDRDTVRGLAGSSIIMRLLITGEPVDDDVMERLVDNVMIPLLTAGRG